MIVCLLVLASYVACTTIFGELASRRDILDPRIGHYTYLLDPNCSGEFSYGLGLAL